MGVVPLKNYDFYWKFMILSDFPGLRYRIFLKMNVFWSILNLWMRFFDDFRFLIRFWRVLVLSFEFWWWFFDEISNFGRVSGILGDRIVFGRVFAPPKPVNGICNIQKPWFLLKIHDFVPVLQYKVRSWRKAKDFQDRSGVKHKLLRASTGSSSKLKYSKIFASHMVSVSRADGLIQKLFRNFCFPHGFCFL